MAHKEYPIHSKDRGHAHTGMTNMGKANHQHGKARKGKAKSPKTAHAGGPHPVFGKRGK